MENRIDEIIICVAELIKQHKDNTSKIKLKSKSNKALLVIYTNDIIYNYFIYIDKHGKANISLQIK